MKSIDLKFDVMFNHRLGKELNKLLIRINEIVDNINYLQDKWEEDHRSLTNVINANVTLQLQIEELKLKKEEEIKENVPKETVINSEALGSKKLPSKRKRKR